MDELENKIKKVWEEMEEDAPSGHFQRFEERLGYSREPEKKRQWVMPMLKIAALFVIVLVTGQLYLKSLQQPDDGSNSSRREVAEATGYYEQKIREGMLQLNRLAMQYPGNEREVQALNRELNSEDENFENLQSDYKKNPEDERVKNALIVHYQTKLNVILAIQSEFEQLKINTIRSADHSNKTNL